MRTEPGGGRGERQAEPLSQPSEEHAADRTITPSDGAQRPASSRTAVDSSAFQVTPPDRRAPEWHDSEADSDTGMTASSRAANRIVSAGMRRILDADTINAIISKELHGLPEHWVEEPYPEGALTEAAPLPEESAAEFVEATLQPSPDILEVGLIVGFDSASQPPPNALILGQEVPAGWTISGSDPDVSSWDPESRTAKWLFMGESIDNLVVTVCLSLESETAADPRGGARSWLRYRLPDGSFLDAPPARRVTIPKP